MFLPSLVAEFRLSDQGYGAHVLRSFDTEISRQMTTSMVSYLLDPATETSVIHSKRHLDWILECTGNAFSLPITAYETIVNAKDLYRKWLFEGSAPAPFLEHRDHYVQAIMCHMSLLFVDRKVSGSSLEKFSDLGSKVLDTFCDISRFLGSQVSSETISVLLKVLLAICHELLVHSTETSSVANDLSGQALKSLFDAWIRAHVQLEELWKLLDMVTFKWVSRKMYVITFELLSFLDS